METETEIQIMPKEFPTGIEIEFAKAEKPVMLVTGSAGLIGSKIVTTFTPHYRVVGIDLKPLEQNVAGAEWMECDLTKDVSINQTLSRVREKYGERIASVIHLAAFYDFSGEPNSLYRTLTVEGTRRLL